MRVIIPAKDDFVPYKDYIGSRLEVMDVEKGLKEAMKTENVKLKQDLDAAIQEKETIQADLNKQVQDFQVKAKSVEQELQTRDARVKELETKISDVEKKMADTDAAAQKIKEAQGATATTSAHVSDDPNAATPAAQSADKEVVLDKIVVNKTDTVKGRVLSVDKETEFIIFDLGAKSGIKQGDVMSVVRGQDYLGDIKVSRVQDEMSAADLIPPFSSRMVRKNDSVVPKQ